MPNRPLFRGAATVEVNQERYETLIAAEERLYILETAIQKLNFYNADFETFKRLFNLDEKIESATAIAVLPEGENA